MGTGHLWYFVKALKVAYPFPPFVQVPICDSAHMQTFGEMDAGHLGYPFRELGVTYSFLPNVHFPQMSICPGAHFPRCPFAPNIHFPQEPICAKSPFTSLPICLECSFAIRPVPICPGQCRINHVAEVAFATGPALFRAPRFQNYDSNYRKN